MSSKFRTVWPGGYKAGVFVRVFMYNKEGEEIERAARVVAISYKDLRAKNIPSGYVPFRFVVPEGEGGYSSTTYTCPADDLTISSHGDGRPQRSAFRT